MDARRLLCVVLLVSCCGFSFVMSSGATNQVKANLLASYVASYQSWYATDASTYLASINSNGSWSDVDYTRGCNSNRATWAAATHLTRVQYMTSAWYTPTSTLYKNTPLLNGTLKALDYWLSNDYSNEQCTQGGGGASCPCGTSGLWNTNWWYNMIGIPQIAAEICILLQAGGVSLRTLEITGCERIMGRADPTAFTGANVLWMCGVDFQNGLFTPNDTLTAWSFARANQEVFIASGGLDGIKQDASFFQHNQQIYNGGYGQDFLNTYTGLQKYANGTNFGGNSTQIDIFSHFVLDGTRWMTWFTPEVKVWDPSVTGRQLAWPKGLPYSMSASDILATTSSWPRSSEFASWASSYSSPPATNAFTGNKHFWNSDYMVHRRGNYYTSVRMISNRTRASECVNTQNTKGNHVADGANFLMQTGLEYYTAASQGISAAWDWYKIPGITIDYNDVPLYCWNPPLGITDFVGGVSDGEYGVAAFNYISVNRRALSYKKSWFFFDTEYVVLAADITCTNSTPVYSVIDQRFLDSPVYSSHSGVNTPAPNGTTQSYNDIWWLHHANTGYLFPDNMNFHGAASSPPATVSFSQLVQSGNWVTISNGFSGSVSASVFAAWLTRQTTPPITGDSISYIVVPGVTLSSFTSSVANQTLQDIVILSNTPELQAVYHSSLNILGATFFTAGSLPFQSGWNIQVSAPCVVLLKETVSNGVTSFEMNIADPTQLLSTVTLTVDRSPLYCDSQQCTTTGSTTAVTFSLPTGGYAGSSSKVIGTSSPTSPSSSLHSQSIITSTLRSMGKVVLE